MVYNTLAHFGVMYESLKVRFFSPAPVHSDGCYCPEMEARKWLKRVGCPGSYAQLSTDLQPFPKRSVNFETVLQRTVEKFYHPGSHSFCHYAILDNEVISCRNFSKIIHSIFL